MVRVLKTLNGNLEITYSNERKPSFNQGLYLFVYCLSVCDIYYKIHIFQTVGPNFTNV